MSGTERQRGRFASLRDFYLRVAPAPEDLELLIRVGALDDFGLTRMEQQQQFDLLEIIEDRHGKASTIIVSQLPVTSWFDVITETTIADAILDRLVHSAYRIELKGPSMRKKR